MITGDENMCVNIPHETNEEYDNIAAKVSLIFDPILEAYILKLALLYICRNYDFSSDFFGIYCFVLQPFAATFL